MPSVPRLGVQLHTKSGTSSEQQEFPPAPSPAPCTPVFDVTEGIYDVVSIDPTIVPFANELDGLGIRVFYKKLNDGKWKPWLVETRSALLRSINVRGYGIYAASNFTGPSDSATRMAPRPGQTIGYYQEGACSIASDVDADSLRRVASEFVARGKDKLVIIKQRGSSRFELFDGDSPRGPDFPTFHYINDALNIARSNNVELNDTGMLRATRNIPAVNWDASTLGDFGFQAELSFSYGKAYWDSQMAVGREDQPILLEGRLLSAVDEVFSHLSLRKLVAIGCDAGKQPCRRSSRLQPEAFAPVPDLNAVERDGNGRVVYVDLAVGTTDSMSALQAQLKTIQPSQAQLLRMPLINRSRVLVEVDDQTALNFFQVWMLDILGSASDMGDAIRELVAPLGQQILLLGGHFISPRVTEYEPRILPQTPHTDVGITGEVIGIGLHVQGEPMRTLLDPHATLDSDGNVQGGTGFRQASTPAFAFETGAVHAGPGVPHVAGPYPRFITNRIFFLMCSAELPPARIAKHRADNGLLGSANLVFTKA
jgi:hypothetical protein